MSRYDVLVLMSTYNGEKFITEQLDSILCQEGCNVHLLIRDDGSTDGTKLILKKYASCHENISLMKDGGNLKPAKSFMTLLCSSLSYEYYAFADQDDIWKKDKLLAGIKVLEGLEIPAIYTANAYFVDSKGESMNKLEHTFSNIHTNAETILSISQFLGCTMVFNDKLADIIRTGGIPDTIIMHDFYLSSVCVLIGGLVKYDPEPHMYYRQHANNTIGVSSSIISKVQERTKRMFLKKKVNVYDQLKDIYARYPTLIKREEKKFADIIIKSENSLYCRIRLFLSRRVHYENMNQAISHRVAFLLGNK